jgi:precorrin-3B synthase
VTVPGETAIVRADRRGECPSVHEPFLELDGALVRIRVPGGLLGVDAARAIANVAVRVGAGAVEITNRANLQLRGIAPSLVTEVGDALVAAGVALSDVGADERRNVLASPLAGVDATELIDIHQLVVAVDGLLASGAAAGCSPKFGVLVDGGGAVHVRGRALDVAVGAVRMDDGTVRYDVRLADALPLEYDRADTVWSCEPEAVLDVIAAVIDVCRPFGRVRALLDAWGVARVWDEIADRAGNVLVCSTSAAVQQPWSGPSIPAVGVHPQRQAGRVAVGAVAALGRLDAPTLTAVTEIADAVAISLEDSDRTLRLSPGRGLVITDVPEAECGATAAQLDALGLVTDPDHPANAVVACIGTRGCAAGYVDTLTDAGELIDALAALPTECRPRSVHVSGCEKGCADPGRTEWALVGGPEFGTYTAHSDSRAGDQGSRSRFGAEVARGLEGSAAVALVTNGTLPR